VKLLSSIGRQEREPSPDDELRRVKVENARKNTRWVELEEVDLVRRGPYFVSATTDALFVLYRGASFGRSGRIEFAETVELYYFVRDGDVTLVERVTSPASWSEVVERRAKRQARASS
jgi:hypothetical protein